MYSFVDYATGFGGKYGVQKDRVDQVMILRLFKLNYYVLMISWNNLCWNFLGSCWVWIWRQDWKAWITKRWELPVGEIRMVDDAFVNSIFDGSWTKIHQNLAEWSSSKAHLSTRPSLRCLLVLVFALHDICLQFFLSYLSWTSCRGHVGDSTVCLEPILMGQNKLCVGV